MTEKENWIKHLIEIFEMDKEDQALLIEGTLEIIKNTGVKDGK